MTKTQKPDGMMWSSKLCYSRRIKRWQPSCSGVRVTATRSNRAIAQRQLKQDTNPVRSFLTLSVCLVLCACSGGTDGPAVIDGSSPEALNRTLAAAKRDLGPKDRLKFEAALAEFRARTFAKADSRQEYQKLLRDGLDGLTGPRVVAQFNKDVDRVGGDAADAAFDVKRVLKGQ
jgi:hypothetical protein